MRIVLAEDAAVIRAGLAEILADRGHKVGAAAGDTALDPELVTGMLNATRHAGTQPRGDRAGARRARAHGRGPLQQRHRRSAR
jgi:hypothetical protein